MLSGITNFLFGGDASGSEMAVDCDNLDLRTTLADNEWVFVDKSSGVVSRSPCGRLSASPRPSGRLLTCRLRGRRRRRSSGGSCSSSSVSPPECVCHPSLQESWVVTPPACFIAGSISPARAVATGPLEDLLIEHPSMSVYGATDGGAVVTATVRVRQPPRRPRAVADRAGLSAGVAAAAAAAAAARRQKTGGAARKKEERSNRLGRRAASGKELRRCNAYALRSAPAAQRRC